MGYYVVDERLNTANYYLFPLRYLYKTVFTSRLSGDIYEEVYRKFGNHTFIISVVTGVQVGSHSFALVNCIWSSLTYIILGYRWYIFGNSV